MKANSALGTVPKQYYIDKDILVDAIRRLLFDAGIASMPVNIPVIGGDFRCTSVSSSTLTYTGNRELHYRRITDAPRYMLNKIYRYMSEELKKQK
jgi:hypothetical protein